MIFVFPFANRYDQSLIVTKSPFFHPAQQQVVNVRYFFGQSDTVYQFGHPG